MTSKLTEEEELALSKPVLIDVADDKGVTKTMKAVFKRFTEGRRKIPKSKDQEYAAAPAQHRTRSRCLPTQIAPTPLALAPRTSSSPTPRLPSAPPHPSAPTGTRLSGSRASRRG